VEYQPGFLCALVGQTTANLLVHVDRLSARRQGDGLHPFNGEGHLTVELAAEVPAKVPSVFVGESPGGHDPEDGPAGRAPNDRAAVVAMDRAFMRPPFGSPGLAEPTVSG